WRRGAGLEEFQALILADGDELHLGGNEALAGVPQLGDRMTPGGAQRATTAAVEAGEFHQAVPLRLAGVGGVLAREIAVVLRPDLPAVVFLDVAALADPILAQGRQTLLDRALPPRIAPRTGTVIDAHRLVPLASV